MRISRYLKPIAISLSPNVQRDDVLLALRILLKTLPISHLRKEAGGGKQSTVSRLEEEFKNYLSAKHAFSFNSGRSALYTILKAIDIKPGDEVLLQAFTCNAVPNPVLWTGGTPVYVDIEDSLNIDPDDLERKLKASIARGGNPRAIVIQNTFGVPAQLDRILEIARRHNLIVIEDCAHALGAKYNRTGSDPVLLGAFGDVAFFSFGRDKVISAVWGGIVATNDDALASKIRAAYGSMPTPSAQWTIKQLMHPILFSIISPSYYIFGKYLLAFLRIARGVGLAVSAKERRGEKPDMFPARMPEALAELALHQFGKLEIYNEHRLGIAAFYINAFFYAPSLNVREGARGVSYSQAAVMPPKINGAIYLRFNIRHPHATTILQEAKKQHLLLGDWYKNVIDPVGTDFAALRYTPGSCPRAEQAARESINLPTHIGISKQDAETIANFFKQIKNPF